VGALALMGCASTGPAAQPPGPARAASLTAIDATVAALQQHPPWLFPAGECPADVAAPRERGIAYLADRCAPDAQACLGDCQRGDGNACYALALLLEGLNVGQPEQAALFLRGCRFGIVSGCTNRAAYIVRVERPDRDRLGCAARTFRMTCERSDPWGCTMLGELLSEGHGVPQDLEEALRVLRRGCTDGGDGPSCKRAKELEHAILARQGRLGI
jgi:hypothetical protein